jgi:hypothetical protein
MGPRQGRELATLQVGKEIAMNVRWLALGLSVLLVTTVHGQPAVKDEPATKPAAEPSAADKPVDKPAKPTAKKADKKADKKAEKKAEKPKSDEPKTTTVDKLPGPLKTLHVCAMPKATVEIDTQRYAKSTVFFISCTAARGGLTPSAVYVARDAKGSGAKLVTFEALAPDGNPYKLDMLYSVAPAWEAFTKEGDQQPHAHVKDDTPWLVGAWAPDDRPGVCAVSATWRLQGDKGELYLWEEAKECPKGELPKYEAKTDRKPPPLVGR